MNRNEPQFGPWATALHYSTRLELSAFWQRRLGRLSSLPTARTRLSRASALALCFAAGALLFAPRLRFDDAALAQEAAASQPATAADPQAASDEPFTATFSNGVKVQLIGLSENPSKGKPWWTPDGEKLKESLVPYARVPAVGRHGLVREVCWRWINLPDDPDVETRWMTEPNYSGAGGGRALDANNKEIEGLTAWMVGFDPPRETCTVRFSISIAATPWTTAFSDDGRNPSAIGKTVEGVPQGAIFSPARADNGGTSITVSYQIPNRAVRLVAVDRDGLLDRATSTGGGVMEFEQMTFRFAGLPPEKIERYDLQTQVRQFETIEFRNVSLHSDKRTKVEIVRLPAEMPKRGGEKTFNAAGAAQDRYRRSSELINTLVQDYGYRLEAGRPLKRMPPPFPPARDEYWALHSSPTLVAADGAAAPTRNGPVRPGFMVMQWTGEALQPNTYHFSAPTLAEILDDVFNLKLQDLQGDLRFVVTGVPGDWIVSWDARQDRHCTVDDIAVLEGILRDELGIPIRLTLREVERPVYVATGSYKFTAVAGSDGMVHKVSGRVAEKADGEFQIPLTRSGGGSSVGSFQDFLHSVGETILTPIVDEATVRPEKESFFWHRYGDAPKDFLGPYDEAQVNDLLASISKQTGLTFVKENRPVKTLVIERSAD